MAKKKAKKKTTQSVDTVNSRTATMYAKRDQQAQFREMDEQGPSPPRATVGGVRRRVESG